MYLTRWDKVNLKFGLDAKSSSKNLREMSLIKMENIISKNIISLVEADLMAVNESLEDRTNSGTRCASDR